MSANKEPSDKLNPAVEVSGEIAPRKRRTIIDYLALALATCGVGYLPLAPGTWGSVVGVGLYLLMEFAISRLARLWLSSVAWRDLVTMPVETPRLAIKLVVILVVTLVGFWAASRAEKLFQRKDPGAVVIDEVAGQMIALLSVPFLFPGWLPIISAFFLFRLFDIWKPYPIRRLEALESGLGIMMDDVVAGIYAAIANSVLIAIVLAFLSRG